MSRHKFFLSIVMLFLFINSYAIQLPKGFVDLHSISPSIQYHIRYAGSHNFIGRPVKGYHAARCLLTKPAALALAKVQNELLKSSLSLMVYDCYRPQQAVNDFVAWSQHPNDTRMKNEFYPHVNKKNVFRLGYVAEQSGHSRGSTVDLTIIPSKSHKTSVFKYGQTLISCFAPYLKRFRDGSIDMGTGFDCMDKRSYPTNTQIGLVPYQHRMLLQKVMKKYGFNPYSKEWWHFTLKNELFPHTFFNFPIE